MASDFEFELKADNDTGLDEFEGWGFEGAKKGLSNGDKKGVDIDEIIARRRDKKNGGKKVEDADVVPEVMSCKLRYCDCKY
jgi:ATP-dependent RNA helicase DDX27